MRRGLLIDALGRVHAPAASPPPPAFLYVGMASNGAEVAFHVGSVALPALARALRLLLSCRPSRIALRLLPEAGEPERLFASVWDFARHAERLALPASAPAADEASDLARPRALVSRFSFL
jgi:hypothetical protein